MICRLNSPQRRVFSLYIKYFNKRDAHPYCGCGTSKATDFSAFLHVPLCQSWQIITDVRRPPLNTARMKVFSIFILAALVLAACGSAATPTVAPQATSTLPVTQATTGEATQSLTPSSTPTTTPTKIVSGNTVTLGNSIFLFTDKNNTVAVPIEMVKYEKDISMLTGGEKVVAVLYYSKANDQNRVAMITGDPKMLLFNGIVRTCAQKCDGTYANMNGVKFDVAIQKLKDTGKTTLANLIETARKEIDTGKMCMVSNARYGEIFSCADMPTATITPSPTMTITPSPTFTPSFTPSSTITPLPSQTPGG